MRSKGRSLLFVLLLALMVLSLSFGTFFAVAAAEEAGTAGEGTGEGTQTEPLTVEAIGWGGSANEAKTKGVANINEADRVEFQIWFSDAIDSGEPTSMLQRPEGLAIEAAASALRYVEINGKTLQTIFDELTAISKSNVIQDDLFGLHVQGNSHNLQFSMKKSIMSRADGKYASLGTDCYFRTEAESPFKITKENEITVRAGFTAMGKTVAEDVSYVFQAPAEGGNGTWIKDTAEEVKITSVTSQENSDEVSITVTFDKPINKETVNHMARDNDGTVAIANPDGQAKLDNIKANGLRESVRNLLKVGGKTIKERIDLNKNTADVTDYDGKLDVHVKGGTDGNKIEIHIKKGVDGSIALEDGLAVTFLGGFRSDLGKFSKDVTFVYNPPVLDDQGGTWVKDTDTELSIKAVTSSVDAADNGNICIQVRFNNEINKETVNFAARETENTVFGQNGNSWAPLDNIKGNGLRYSLWNKLAFNGYTFKQLLQMNKDNRPANGDYDGQMDIHVKNANDGSPDGNALFIYINKASKAAEVVTYENGLTVTLLQGFRSDLAKVSETLSYKYTDGVWEQEGVVIVREELGIQSVTSEDKADEIAITVMFDKAINEETVNHMARENEGTVSGANNSDGRGQEKLDHIKANGLRQSVWDKITVGGKTIWDIMQANKENPPAGGDVAGSVDVHVKAGADGNKIEIHIKKNFAGSVAIEEGLQLVFLGGFKSDLVTVSTDLKYNYIRGAWYKEGEEPPEQKEVEIVNIYHTDNGTDLEIYVQFSGPLNKDNINNIARDNAGTLNVTNPDAAAVERVKNNGLRDSTRESVMINNMTIKEMIAKNFEKYEQSQDPDGKIDVHIEDNATRMRIVLKVADNWLGSEDATLTIKSTFHSDVAKVSADIVCKYSAQYNVWLMPGEDVPEFEEIELSRLDAPLMKGAEADMNVEFVLHFNTSIDALQHAYISTNAGFAGSVPGVRENYTSTQLSVFTKFGIFDAMATKILLNGKSVKDMIDEASKIDADKWSGNQGPRVAVVHTLGGDALRLVIGGQYVVSGSAEPLHNPCQITDLNQNFVITVKAGFRTPLGQEVKEDISFIYDPNTNQWYEGSDVSAIPVTVTVTFMDGETVLDTKSCLKGQTITAGIGRKEGYTFGGWFTDAALTQAWDSSVAIEADMTVYAKFTENVEQPPEKPAKKKGCRSDVAGSVAGIIACLTAIGLTAGMVATKRRKNK